MLSGGVSAPRTSSGTSNGFCICGGSTENVYFPFFKPVNANLPSGPVFDSITVPCSLLAFTGILAMGLPSKSISVPVILPSCCAAARVARLPNSPSVRITASAHAFMNFNMPHFSFDFEERRPWSAGRFAPLSLISSRIQGPGKLFRGPHASACPIGDRVGDSGDSKRPQPQQATVTGPAGLLLASVAGPGQLEGRMQFESAADNLAFLQANHRRDDFDLRFGARPAAYQFPERFVIFGPTIGIPRTVLGDRADIKRARAGRFGPTDTNAQKMRVAERNVGHRDGAFSRRTQLIFRDVHAGIGERGAANGAEIVEADGEPLFDLIEIGNFRKCTPLARLRSLAI